MNSNNNQMQKMFFSIFQKKWQLFDTTELKMYFTYEVTNIFVLFGWPPQILHNDNFLKFLH